MTWVLEEAPGVRPHLVAALLGLANHADRDGRGSFPSQATLARYARKTDRAIRNDLDQLEADGLIARGDQRLVEHLPADERPVVWDLAVDRKQVPPGKGTGSTVPPGSPVPAGSTASEGPEAQCQEDRKHSSDKPTAEPRDEPKNSPSGSSTRERTRGTRIPDEFPVTDDMRRYARHHAAETLGREPAERFDAWLDRKHLDFVDYWHEKSGAAAVKRDWTRAWQRWMRAEIERSAERPPTNGARASPEVRPHNGLMLSDRTIARIEDNARFQAMDAAEAQLALGARS